MKNLTGKQKSWNINTPRLKYKKVFRFFHPDYTVGMGFTPIQLSIIKLTDLKHMLITASEDFHLALKQIFLSYHITSIKFCQIYFVNKISNALLYLFRRFISLSVILSRRLRSLLCFRSAIFTFFASSL